MAFVDGGRVIKGFADFATMDPTESPLIISTGRRDHWL
jgi:hypothetical protein